MRCIYRAVFPWVVPLKSLAPSAVIIQESNVTPREAERCE